MIELKKNTTEIIRHQERMIKRLSGFIWDISANPDILRNDQLLNRLIDYDFNSATELLYDQTTIAKIAELERQLFNAVELLEISRDLINAPQVIKSLDINGYNKLVDAYKCSWVNESGELVGTQND